ncbi:MAG TPA: phytanoyl-CoA dioxygenase family protein [Chthonomonadales bacterium]|nr:phytanoyl-CoA dioxygenase family protein [Chthonomonadales bacterium]
MASRPRADDFAVPALTAEQIGFYHSQGYLALPALVSPAEVEWMRKIYDELFARRAGREEGNQFDLGGPDQEGEEAVLPQILGPARYAPELREGRYLAAALQVATQLLGPEAQFTGDHAIFKPALTGAATPWHQDEAYWNPALQYNSISIWIPLQPATIENGCMWFVPGSHLMEVQPHHCINNDVRIHGLEVDTIDASAAVACPLDAGGCTIHHNRTLHFTGPNLSDTPRRAYILGFGTPAQPREQPRDFYWNTQKRTPREARARAKG